MDLLKRELQKKRQSLENDFGGRKLLKRSEIEQKMIQKLREEEQRQLQSKALRSSFPSAPNPSHQSSLPPSLCSNKPLSEERRIDDLDLPRHEVIRRLRILKQPVTLFGEDDEARLRRLKVTLNSGPLEIDDTDMTEGQTNDFLRDIYELRRRQKIGILHDRAKPKMEDGERTEGSGTADGGAADNEVSGDGGSSGVDVDKDLKRMKADFLDLCDEDKILVFFKRLLNEWNQELEEMPEAEKRTAKGKFMVATFNQCARYLNPLFKMCRKKTLSDDIRRGLLVVVECCMKRDYLAAMDQYIKLAIGNAPWPIGVTMVGIHERSAREKIYTNSVAHIMNDETTRKYLQSVKRLMTFCQRRYPADPSRSVEFDSLANRSDLQSFMAEEKAAKSSASEERLRLVSAAH
ncbi:pre-mRNA-splicing factor 18-like [Phoenix dactylifera]|uniref:Pre-mRNA-splicing factor 18 n=1 Tax=Phoenix dactylifera TaxID=42345 RepID=A0A8B7CLL9_PHODC|nr:pre-mRNA-splicing factor 18-like [Phoenix dactylifera]